MKWKRIKDRIYFPVVALVSSDAARSLGLTPLDDERLLACLAECRGRVLDIGCGTNRLVRAHGNGVGVDVFPWAGCDQVVEDTSKLPFPSASFDTVVLMASLNHITNRLEVLQEAYRLLRPGGRILVTMINPVVGYVVHKLRYRHDEDQTERGMKEGEAWGLWSQQVVGLMSQAGFVGLQSKGFVFHLNTLYMGTKPMNP